MPKESTYNSFAHMHLVNANLLKNAEFSTSVPLGTGNKIKVQTLFFFPRQKYIHKLEWNIGRSNQPASHLNLSLGQILNGGSEEKGGRYSLDTSFSFKF